VGEFDRALASAQRALTIAEQREDFGSRVAANTYLGYVYRSLGDNRRAAEVLGANVRSIQGDRLRERFGLMSIAAVTSRAWLAGALADLGDFSQATALGEEALALALGADHDYSIVAASIALGDLYRRGADVSRAVPHLERAHGLAQAGGFRNLLRGVEAGLAEVLALVGRMTEAVPLLERARASLGQAGAGGGSAFAVVSEGYLLAGRREDAQQIAEQGLHLYRRRKQRGNEAWTLCTLGRVTAHADSPDLDQAEHYYREARTLAEEIGMRPLVAHCHLGLGTLYQKASRDDEAQAELATAAEMYRAMEMAFWLEKAELSLAQVAR
jgi:tetratricopeptide (TPR) repeat protein